MNFISYEFLIFFFIVFSIYPFLKHKSQNIFLLVASYVFYGAWDWRFLGLIFLSSVVDYTCALMIEADRKKNNDKNWCKIYLTISVVANLGILSVFKYCNFFMGSLEHLFATFGIGTHLPVLQVILPVGISFYTFQTMSYTIDVYRGKITPTKDFIELMLYVSFFPQLVAGPIERGEDLLPQVQQKRLITHDKVYSGAQLAFVGFIKKMVIADNLAVVANDVFNRSDLGGLAIILGIYAFAFQIYCDFSGYTDIARGVARMLGFELRLNFRMPYFSKNPSEFWERWHISLSSWLRDYLYFPLGGNRGGTLKTFRNLCITMLLGGLWHGASWHFVAWGAYHGILLVTYRIINSMLPDFLRHWSENSAFVVLRILFFFQLTCLGWLIFRVTDMGQFFKMLEAIFNQPFMKGMNPVIAAKVAIACIPLTLFQLYQHFTKKLEPWTTWPVWASTLFYVVAFYGIVFFGEPVSNAFIYFQF